MGWRPPRSIEALLRLAMGDGLVARTMRGDLREEATRRAREHGALAASLWYGREALGLTARSVVRLLLGDGGWESPAHDDDGWRMTEMWGRMWTGLARTIRSLRRAPGFAIVAATTLALAIGANATIFSVADAVLLEPLPYDSPDRLVRFRSQAPGLNVPDEFGVSPEFYLLFRDAPGIEDLGLYNTAGAILQLPEGAARLTMANVTPSLLSTLGVPPRLGQVPSGEEILADPGAHALISDGLWRREFGGDPEIVGRTIQVNGAGRTITGIMPPGFDFPDQDTDVWGLIEVDEATVSPGQFTIEMVGRLAPGATPASTEAEIAPLVARLSELYASSPRYVAFLRQGEYRTVVRDLKDEMVGDMRDPLLILLGTAGLVLLIACANVANLFVARAEGRQRTVAVQAALGAGRGRLIALHLGEALVLGVAGGIGGVILAAMLVPVVLGAAPPDIPRLGVVGLDASVLAFTAIVTAVAALLFGAAPAVRYSSPAVLSELRSAGRGQAGRGRLGARNMLVILQTSLALILLVGSGLLLRSFGALSDVEAGFEPGDVLTFRAALVGDEYGGATSIADFHDRFMERIASLPGVESVGLTGALPMDGSANGTAVEIESTPTPADELPSILYVTQVSHGYFETMEIDLEAGRTFTRSDHLDPATGGVVVSRGLAERIWPGQDPLGKRIRLAADTAGWDVVVGVVGDVRNLGLRQDPQDMIYYPMVTRAGDQGQQVPAPAYVVRARNPTALTPAIRKALQGLDGSIPMYRVQTMEAVVSGSVVRLSFTMLALALASGMALTLGAVGLYGVLSYVVGQRTREFGVRLALGARADQVLRMVVGQGTLLVVAGLVLGLAGAAGLTGLLQGLLYGTEPLDPVTFGAMALLMLAVGFMASWIPARRAGRVDPIECLRDE